MTDSEACALFVFVIAHPDDESMFFLPTIQSLPSSTKKWLICLSNGNYDGLGKEREVELNAVALGILRFDRLLLHTQELQDSPIDQWSERVIADILQQDLAPESVSAFSRVYILTFDSYGVSGHRNHRDTYSGVRCFLSDKQEQERYQRQQQFGSNGCGVGSNVCNRPIDYRGWELVSERNAFVKYVPVHHWLWMIFAVWLLRYPAITAKSTRPSSSAAATDVRNQMSAESCSSRVITDWSYTMYQPLLNWKCMARHHTQFVWYRRLFVVFSVYTYSNRWREIPVP